MADVVLVDCAGARARARTAPRCRWECACASGGGGASQSLKSPTTLTPVALGAQTAKFTPSTPSIVRNCAPSLLVAGPVRAFAEQVQVVVGQQRRKRVGIVHDLFRCRARRPRAAGSCAVLFVRVDRANRLVQAGRMDPPHRLRSDCAAGSTTQAWLEPGKNARTASARRPAVIDLVRSQHLKGVLVMARRAAGRSCPTPPWCAVVIGPYLLIVEHEGDLRPAARSRDSSTRSRKSSRHRDLLQPRQAAIICVPH